MAEALTTILVADDQHLVRAGFRVILNEEPDLDVIAEAADGRQAVEMTRELGPKVVLMDIRMPVMDGLQAAREIVATTQAKVLMLTTFDADEYVYEALRLGASGFLLKDADPDQLIAAVRVVARGDALIDPTVTRRLIHSFAQSFQPLSLPPSAPQPPAQFTALTPRELDVVHQIVRGLSNREIARELFVEESTVRTHVTRILTKLGLRDRVQVVVLAYEAGLVTPPSRSM